MSPKEFRISQFRDQLYAFLQTDCGKAMLDLLEKKPNSLPSINGIHHTDAVVARMYAFDAGINHAALILKSLAEPWVEQSPLVEATNREQWTDGLPPEIKAAIAQQQQRLA